jgi:hypothetical protein
METLEEKKVDRSKFLPRKKVAVMPVPRQGAMIDDPKHRGYFMFTDTKVSYCLPYDIKRGSFVIILNDEEREFFEKELGRSLNFYEKDKKKNFWKNFWVVIQKTDDLMTDGMILDLSDVMDNLRYRVLQVVPEVAPSWEDRYESGEYRFALRDVGYTEVELNKKADLNITAYKHFMKIIDSRDKMFDFLSIYWMQNTKGKRPSEESSKDMLISNIQGIIDNDILGFIEVSEDKHYDTKLMIYRAMAAGLITKESNTRDYVTVDPDTKTAGKYLGRTIDDAVSNILSPEFQDERIRIDALVKPRKTK